MDNKGEKTIEIETKHPEALAVLLKELQFMGCEIKLTGPKTKEKPDSSNEDKKSSEDKIQIDGSNVEI
jgi:hypothetical protein